MIKPANPPAFPFQQCPAHCGMTLRDYFAGQALPTVLFVSEEDDKDEELAARTYKIADAMLSEREKAND